MQVFQPSSVLSVVGQASREYRVLRRDWLSVLSLMGTLGHRKIIGESSKIQDPSKCPSMNSQGH